METGPKTDSPDSPEEQRSLTKVLVQSEHVKTLVEQSVDELSSVNADIKQELEQRGPLPGVENALEKSEAVEGKVQEACDELSVVNQALKGEVKERYVLEEKLAAVTEQGELDRRAALHDLLTGLPNRSLFHDRLEHAFQQAKRQGWTLAIMFVDLDDFKIVNDTYGHDAGDSVLQTIALRLKEAIRGGDTVSRHGGDEFLILFNEIRHEANLSRIAEKIIKKIQVPCDIRTRDFIISRSIMASIGISVFPKDGTTADTLVMSADRAMYVAKRSKSGYCFAQLSQSDHASRVVE